MEHIKKYKRYKFYQLISLIVFFALLYFLEKELFSFVLVAIYIIQLFFSQELLHEIEIKEEEYVFKTYFLFYKNKQLIIPRNEFISIEFISESIFRNDSIEISFKGEYAEIKRSFYINSSPWDELNHNIIFLKNNESNNIKSIELITDNQS
jgi:hypothetical protein